jgi:hypothetical protein
MRNLSMSAPGFPSSPRLSLSLLSPCRRNGSALSFPLGLLRSSRPISVLLQPPQGISSSLLHLISTGECTLGDARNHSGCFRGGVSAAFSRRRVFLPTSPFYYEKSDPVTSGPRLSLLCLSLFSLVAFPSYRHHPVREGGRQTEGRLSARDGDKHEQTPEMLKQSSPFCASDCRSQPKDGAPVRGAWSWAGT